MEYYFKRQLCIMLVIYLGQVMVGFGLGWTGSIIPILQDPEETPLPDVVSSGQSSWIGSVLYIGTITGPYVSSYISNHNGRKPCFLLGGVLTVFAFLILAFARNMAMIIAGRIFTGLGTGIIFVINLVYIGEIASTNVRGMFLTGTGIFGTFGTLVVYVIGPYAPYSVTNYVGIGITVLYLLGLMIVPESPMFHVLKGNEDKARDILLDLGRHEDIDTLLSVKHDTKQEGSLKDLYKVKSNRRAFFITLTLGILQQLSGIIVVVFYATWIFEMAGSSLSPHLATIVIGVTQIVSSSIAPFVVERGGRRVLLMWSTALCCFSLAILGAYFLLDHLESSIAESTRWLPLSTLVIFFLSYDMGFGIIPGTFIGELFQSDVRSIGSAITVTTAWLFGFAVSTAFGYMIDHIGGYGTFWIFSAACGLAFLFTVIFVPETKGKTLSEIQDMLSCSS